MLRSFGFLRSLPSIVRVLDVSRTLYEYLAVGESRMISIISFQLFAQRRAQVLFLLPLFLKLVVSVPYDGHQINGASSSSAENALLRRVGTLLFSSPRFTRLDESPALLTMS